MSGDICSCHKWGCMCTLEGRGWWCCWTEKMKLFGPNVSTGDEDYSGNYFQEPHCRAILISESMVDMHTAWGPCSYKTCNAVGRWASFTNHLIPTVLKCSSLCFLFQFTEEETLQNLRLTMLDYFLYYYTFLLRLTFYKAQRQLEKKRKMRNKWLCARNWFLFFMFSFERGGSTVGLECVAVSKNQKCLVYGRYSLGI